MKDTNSAIVPGFVMLGGVGSGEAEGRQPYEDIFTLHHLQIEQ